MFKIYKDTYNVQTERGIITNSLTVKVGDTVAAESGFLTNATVSTAGNVYVLGVVVGFSKLNGEVYPATGQDTSVTPNQVTVASDNQTVGKICAVYIPIHAEQSWEADFSAARGTTSTSDLNWQFFDLSDCRTIGESTVTATAIGGKQVVVVADGTTTSKGIVRFRKALYINR